MEPNPDSTFQRVERTLVSVWSYITEAVSRLLRPQPAETANNDPTSSHEPEVDIEPLGCCQTGAEAGREEDGEEVLTISHLSSSSPVVVWERCTADTDMTRKREDHENKEGITEEQLSQTGTDRAEQQVAEDAMAWQAGQQRTEIKNGDTCENDLQKLETLGDILKDDREENKETVADKSKINYFTLTEEEDRNVQKEEQGDNKTSAQRLGDANVFDDASQSISDNEICSDDLETQSPVCSELSQEEQTAENCDVDVQLREEESEQHKRTIEEENDSTQTEKSTKDVQKTTEFTFEEEDVPITIIQPAAEKDLTTEEILADADDEVAEEERQSLSSGEKENLGERTEQGETQDLICKEFSGVVEDKMVQAAVIEEEESKESLTDEKEDQSKGEQQCSIQETKHDDMKMDEANEELENKNNIKQSTVREEEISHEETEEKREGEASSTMLEDANVCDNESQQISEQCSSLDYKIEDVEKQIPVSKELSEDENVQMTNSEEQVLKTSIQGEGIWTIKDAQQEQRTGEEQFSLTGDDSAEQLISEDITAHQLGLEKTEKLPANAEIERAENKADLQEEHRENQEDDGEENEDFGDEHEEKQINIGREEVSNGQSGEQRDGEASVVMLEDVHIHEDPSQLSSEHENSDDRTQVKTQLLVCKELSGMAEDEGVQVAVIEEKGPDKSAINEEPEQKKGGREVEYVQQKEEDVLTEIFKSVVEDQGPRVEQPSFTEPDQAGDNLSEPDLEGENDVKQCTFAEEEDSSGETGEQRVIEEKARSGHMWSNEAASERMDLSEEEQYVTMVTLDVGQKEVETLSDIPEDDTEENKENLEDESKIEECTSKEEQDRSVETEEQGDHKPSAEMLDVANIWDDESELREKTETERFVNFEVSETPEKDGERETIGSGHRWPNEGANSSEEEEEKEEEHVTTVRLDEGQKEVDTLSDIQEDDTEENKENVEDDSKIEECSSTEEDDRNVETEEQGDHKASAGMLGDEKICGDASLPSSESDKTKCEESLNEQNDQNIQITDFREENPNMSTDFQTAEEKYKDKSGKRIEEENVSTQNIISSKDEDKTELDTTEFTFRDNEMISITQPDTGKDVTTEEMSSDVDYEVAEEEEMLSPEVADKESCRERVYTTAPVTVIAEGESAQEVNTGFNHIPQGVIQGRSALSHQLNTEAYEETPEAVPEHNNELESDENITQRFLEGGNSEEIKAIRLPEEVEVFKSSGAGGGEYLPMRQGSTEDSKNQLGLLVGEQFVEDPERQRSEDINLELEHFPQEEKVDLLDSSMKTEIKQSDKEFEPYLADETAPQDGDKTVELEMTRRTEEAGEDGCKIREVVALDERDDLAGETPESLKGEEKKMTDPVQSFSFQDDHGNLRRSIEINPKLLYVSALNVEQIGLDTSEQGVADEEVDLNKIVPLQLEGAAADPITVQSELSQHPEANNQAPLIAAQMTMAEITRDAEKTDESRTAIPEDLPLFSSEVTAAERYSRDPAEEHQDVIDEEILDLWIETVTSKDTPRIKESELGLQSDHLKEELGKKSPEKKEDEVMEAISEKPDTLSKTETLTTLDYRLLDQPISETQRDTKSRTDIDICDFSASNSDSALIRKEAETFPSYPGDVGTSDEIRSCPDSGVSSLEPKHPNQEFVAAQEKSDETFPEREARGGDNIEDDRWLMTKADVKVKTQSEISHEEGKQIDDVEVLLEEQRVLTEPPSGDVPPMEPEEQRFSQAAPEHRCSEDHIAFKSIPDPSRKELEEDQSEVDGYMLDFAIQRSRIAVKNPRARPPTDPRSLIHKPSVDPTPSLPVTGKGPVGVPLGGLGIGIKLPGIGAGFPVLKKTQPAQKDETNPEKQSQEFEEKPEKEEEGAGKKEEAPKRPKWMPPGQPGFGNPLMSELKTKLKKTPNN